MRTENSWIDMVAGVRRRTLVSGISMHQMEVILEAGSHLPEHQHPHEQVVHVAQGRIRLVVGGEAYELGEGESFYLIGDVPHAVDALEGSTVIDTFSPPREDLLAQDRAAQG